MTDDFKVLLGIELDQTSYDGAKIDLDQLCHDRKINIKVELDNATQSFDKLSKQLKKFRKSAFGKNQLPSVGLNQQQIQQIIDEFKQLEEIIDKIHKAVGTLDDTSGAQSLLNVVKSINSALSTAMQNLSGNNFVMVNQQLSNIVSNLIKIENALNGLGGQIQFQNLSQSFSDLANAINSAMNACNNIRNTMRNNNNAMSQMDNVTLNASRHTNALEEAMRGLNINQTEINNATQRLQAMDITVLRVTEHLRDLVNGGQEVDFTIHGVDQNGQNVTAKQKYRRTVRKDGSLGDPVLLQDISVVRQVGQVGKTIDRVAEAYDRMAAARKRMSNAVKDQIGKDPSLDVNEIRRARQEYAEAHKEYQELSSQYWNRFTQDQQQSLRELKVSGLRINQKATSQLIDKNYKDSIASVKKNQGLVSRRNSFEIDIDSWIKENNDAARVFADQISEIKAKLKDCDSQTLSNLKAEFISIQKQASFEGFLSNDDLESNSNRIQKSLSKLKEQSVETQNALQDFYNASAAFGQLNNTSSFQDRINATKQYHNALKNLEAQIENNIQAEKQQQKNTKLDLNQQAFGSSIDVWAKKNSKAAEYFKDELDAIHVKLKDCDEIEFANLKVEFTKLKRQAEATGLTVKSFGDELKEQFEKIATYFTLDYMVDRAVDAIQSMYDQVLKVDTAMTDLLKVTDETDKRYQEFLKSASKNAQNLGRDVSSFITQTAEWSKMGYSLSDSESLASLSSIYSNVGDVDDATAVSDMVTAMKAYRIEATDAVKIIDSLNKISNEFAVGAAGLGSGMANSASAMATSNTTFEQTLALLTGISEITQSPSEAGNFLKVASMRIRAMTGELQELGEEVDSNVDSISKVQTQILNFTHGKVNIFDSNGEFRNYYEILKEISEIFDDLDSTDRANLSNILFGSYRSNQGAALIQAFQSGQIEKAYDAAMHSAGSAMAEQEKFMDSLEAKVEKLSAAWQTLSNTILDSDLLKGLVDTGTNLLNLLNNIIEKVGVLPTLLTGISAVLSANGVGELIKQFHYLITLRNEYAHEAA